MAPKCVCVVVLSVLAVAILAVAAYAADEEQQLAVAQDEMVSTTFPTFNWSSTTSLGGLAVGTDYFGRIARSYLQWDLSTLDPSKGVATAKIRGYLNYKSYKDDRSIELRPCPDDTWLATKITWASAPPPGAAAAAVVSPPLNAGQYYEWDVTQLVTTERAGDKKLSIVLMDVQEGAKPATLKYFAEKEYNGGTTPPVLIVTLNAIQDTTPPVLTVSCSPDSLWPANHQYVTVKVDVNASDDLDASPTVTLVSAVSSEPDDAEGSGDGNTTEDAVVVDDTTLKLRAERAGSGEGRTYTITYRATDAAGNQAEATCTVRVPHDNSDNAPRE